MKPSQIDPDFTLSQRAENRLKTDKDTSLEETSTAEMTRLLHELQVYQIVLEKQNEALHQSQAELLFDIAERKRAEYELKQSELLVQATFDSLAANIALLDDQGEILLVNRAWREFALQNGISSEGVSEGSNYLSVCSMTSGDNAEEAKIFKEGITSVLTRKAEFFSMEYPCHAPHEKRWFAGRVTPVKDDGPRRVIVAHENITERKLAEDALRESEDRFRSILENAPIGMTVVSLDGQFTLVNRSLCEIVGYDKEELEKLTFQEITHPDDLESDLANVKQILKGSIQRYSMEKRYIRKDRHVVWIQLTVSLVKDATGSPLYFISQIEDISKRKQAENALEEYNRRLEALSITDGLTGIANRRHFDEFLAQEYARHARSKNKLSLIMLDVDYFKLFNDNYGHVNGDDCLRQIAQILGSCTKRPSDLVARYGGEEFACILPETGERGALLVAERMRQGVLDLAIPHGFSRAAAHVSASLGVVTIRCYADNTVSDIIIQADELLYRAKSRGRNRVECSEKLPEQNDTNLVQLVWQDSFYSGNQEIDSQHEKLFRDSNELLRAILEIRPKDEISLVIARLLADIMQHFRDEEYILKSVGFPNLEQHALEHEKLLKVGIELENEFISDMLNVGAIFEFLVYEVVQRHILGSDKEFFPYVQNAKVTLPN